jgi:hypothetical protein
LKEEEEGNRVIVHRVSISIICIVISAMFEEEVRTGEREDTFVMVGGVEVDSVNECRPFS